MTPKHNLPVVASDEPVYEISSFEILWERYKSRIIAGAVAIIAVIVGIFGWLIISSARNSAAQTAFANAKTPADYRTLIGKYESSPVAGDAALLLAKSLRDEKKYADANGVLDHFVKTQPKHPFAPLAKVAVAENLALDGKLEEATKALEAIPQSYGKSFAAPYALWTAAELNSAQGKRDAALRDYRELKSSYPESISTRAAAQATQALTELLTTPAPPPPAVVTAPASTLPPVPTATAKP